MYCQPKNKTVVYVTIYINKYSARNWEGKGEGEPIRFANHGPRVLQKLVHQILFGAAHKIMYPTKFQRRNFKNPRHINLFSPVATYFIRLQLTHANYISVFISVHFLRHHIILLRLLAKIVFSFISVSGRSCDRPPRHRFFLVSLCLQANAEMVPKFPSRYYMPLM